MQKTDFPFSKGKIKQNMHKLIMAVTTITVILVVFVCGAYGEEPSGITSPTLPPVYTPEPSSLVTVPPSLKPLPTEQINETDDGDGFLWSNLIIWFSYGCYIAAPLALVAGIVVAVVRGVKKHSRKAKNSKEAEDINATPAVTPQKKKKISAEEYFKLADTEWTDVSASDSKWERKNTTEDNSTEQDELSEEESAAMEEELKSAEEKQ